MTEIPNLWKILTVFLMTIGAVSMLTTLVWSKLIVGDTRTLVSGWKPSALIFALVATLGSLYVYGKSTLGQWKTQDVILVVLVIGLIFVIYTFYPSAFPPSFSVFGW